MVIKGGARGGAAGLSAHLQRLDTNERAVVHQLRGVAARDLDGALSEMEAVALGARSKRHFYHASINTRADETLTPEQWTKAVDRLEKELDLTEQPRAVVLHVKNGRAHAHVVWSRIDLESMTAISDSHNYRRHELVARELEREFGHARVQGVHVERDGEPRPDRTPSHAEMQQAERHRLTPDQATAELTAIWNRTDGGQAFAAAINEQGWTLARGDRRDFVVVDPNGGTHSLVRRIDGATASAVRERMSGLDASSLPSVAEAKVRYRAQPREHQHDTLVGQEVLSQPVSARARSDEQAPATPAQLPHVGTLDLDQTPEAEWRRKQADKPSIATTNAGMVAQQAEAQKRIEQSWIAIRARRHDGISSRAEGVNDQEAKRAGEERPDQDIIGPGGGR